MINATEGWPCYRLYKMVYLSYSRQEWILPLFSTFTTWYDHNCSFMYLFVFPLTVCKFPWKKVILPVLFTATYAGCCTVFSNYLLDDWMDEFYMIFISALLDGKYRNYHTHPINKDMRLQNWYKLGNQNQEKILLMIIIIIMLYWVLTGYNAVC